MLFEVFSLHSIFRQHKESMFTLRKLLTDDSKAKRHNGNLLNIHVTFLAWLTELFGFLIIFLGTFVLGHENNMVTYSMQTVTLVIYFNILPCVYLINELHFKTRMLESIWYTRFLNFFNCQYTKPNYEEESNAAAVENQVEDENQDVDVANLANANDNKKDEKINHEKHADKIIALNQVKKRNSLANMDLDSFTNQCRRQCEFPEVKNKACSSSNVVDVIDLET